MSGRRSSTESYPLILPSALVSQSESEDDGGRGSRSFRASLPSSARVKGPCAGVRPLLFAATVRRVEWLWGCRARLTCPQQALAHAHAWWLCAPFFTWFESPTDPLQVSQRGGDALTNATSPATRRPCRCCALRWRLAS